MSKWGKKPTTVRQNRERHKKELKSVKIINAIKNNLKRFPCSPFA